MRAVIISGGTITDYDYIKSQITVNDTIICADSGYDHTLKMGVIPSVVVGDFDSIENMPRGIDCHRYSARKDLTDTELAIEYARGKGFKEFLMLAAMGGRADHGLTNILLLKTTLQNNEKAMIIDEQNKIMITDLYMELNEPRGSIVSLVPLSDCQGVSTKNLKYSLSDAQLLMGKGLGVSNIMTSDKAAVSVKQGILLVIVARDKH